MEPGSMPAIGGLDAWGQAESGRNSRKDRGSWVVVEACLRCWRGHRDNPDSNRDAERGGGGGSSIILPGLPNPAAKGIVPRAPGGPRRPAPREAQLASGPKGRLVPGVLGALVRRLCIGYLRGPPVARRNTRVFRSLLAKGSFIQPRTFTCMRYSASNIVILGI